MKKTRIIAFALCFAMLFGMFTAFPAIVGLKTVAAGTNYAASSTYYGGSGTSTNGTASYGESDWNTYHTGKLNDGTIDTNYVLTGGNNLEIYVDGYVGGTIYVYFKLPYDITVTEVDVFANIRSTGGNRGYPSAVDIYVGSSETDISDSTKLGTVTYSAYNTSVRKYTAGGSKVGKYVILKFTTTNSVCVMALTEVEIYGTELGNGSFTSAASYKASADCTDNYDSTYGEPDWNIYHSGKLNDGIIATDYVSSTSANNVEFWNGDLSTFNNGTVYLYFALPSLRTISSVNVYANTRSGNTSRDYPTTMNIYVGNSETDISASTKLGTVSYTAYNTAVRKYTASGSKTGTYVIIEISMTSTAIVAALTEVEINPEINKPASGLQYMGNCVANGSSDEDTFGEANWQAYHSGRLTDGVIASTYVPSASSTVKENIEMYLTNFTAGNAYVYFKLPDAAEVSQVNVYANKRNGNASRGYPTAVNVYVGNSETDISAATKLGNSSYCNYNTSVRNYTTYGAKTGSYVILELGVDATECVIALTEVEILTNAPIYTVNFVGFNGAVLSTQSVRRGEAATAPAIPDVEGYTTGTWDKAFNNITANTTVTAQYTQKSYTVTFVGPNGTISTQTVKHGEAAVEPEKPVIEGKSFSAWDKAFNNITADTTVTAVYTTNTYNVVFKDFGGEVLATVQVEHGNAATAPNPPAVDGYNFTGWDKTFENVTGDMEVNAVYQIKSFTVTFKDKDGGVISTDTVEWGKAASAPFIPEVEGYNGAWDKAFDSITADTVVTAVYSIKQYTVTFMADGVVVGTDLVDHGQAANAPFIPEKEGYNSKWDISFDNVTSELTVNAVYSIKRFTVSFTAGEHGTLDGETSMTVDYNTDLASLTYPATVADIGYKFDMWDITEGKIQSDLTINASFAYDASQWFTVSFVIPENGTTSDTTEFGPFVVGTAWADTGITAPNVSCNGLYVFTGWDKEYPTTITENLVYNAIIEIQGNATITIACGENGVICRIVDGMVVIGTYSESVAAGKTGEESISLPMVLADDGYVFDGWYNGDTLYDSTALIDADITLTARFKQVPVSIIGSSVATEGSVVTVTLNVKATNADFATNMYVFNQFANGRTAISIEGVDTVLVSGETDVYAVSFTVAANQTKTVDVFFTNSLIDFTSDSWGIVTAVSGISI